MLSRDETFGLDDPHLLIRLPLRPSQIGNPGSQ